MNAERPNNPNIRSLVVYGTLLAASAVAVFLAGGPAQGSLGIFLVCAGILLTFCPPQVRVDRGLWLAAGGLVACSSLALLPARWFGSGPAWRTGLKAAAAINVPTTVSLVPRDTAFWLAVLAISLLVGLFLLSQPVRSRRLLALATFAALVCGAYAALAIYAKQSGWHYPFASGASFGFFPNRNHTAAFLVVGSILSMGVLGVVLREEAWLVGALAAAVLSACVAGLFFFSASRGGVVFLLAGTVAWVAGLGRTHRNTPLLVSVAVLAMAGGLLFLVSGSEVRNRLLDSLGAKAPVKAQGSAIAAADPMATGTPPAESQGASFDFRVAIYRDTLHLIHDFPITGTGLGGFVVDFAQYRNASLADAIPLHPESDWLMLTAEAGIPALLCAMALGWLLLRRLPGQRDHPYWPLRWGCAVAAGAAALHGLVDVPLHRVQLGWWVLAIAGLALQSTRAAQEKSPRVQHALFIGGGLAALALGMALVRAQWFGGPALPPFVAARAQQEILATFNRHNTEGAMDMARQAVRVSPMSGPLYYQFGVLLLHFEDTDAEVDRVFRAQRLLNPTWPVAPLQQGDAWITVDTNRTVALWLDALERQRRIDRATGAAAGSDVDYYSELVYRARQYPAVQRALGSIATRSPAYALAWLKGVGGEIPPEDWSRLTAQPDLMQGFSESARRQFLVLWYEKGDHAALFRFVDDHPGWRAAAWPIHLRQLIDSRQFEAAVRESAAHYQVSLNLPPANTGAPGSDAAPEPADETLADFDRYWREGNTIAARRVLEEAAQATGKPPPAPECWRLRAAWAVQDLAWQKAWESLKRYLQQTHPTEAFL